MYDVIIIGAGVVGSMVAYELSRLDVSVAVLEAASDAASGASGANSGIVHAGFDAEPGTLKARFNREGSLMMESLCADLGVKYKRNGALVIGFEGDEEKILELYNRGVKNGIDGLSVIGRDELLRIEPSVSPLATSALLASTSAIVCPYSLCVAALGAAMDGGVRLFTDFNVSAIRSGSGMYTAGSTDGKAVTGKYVVNAAGVYSDNVASLVGDHSFTVRPRRGQYMLLDRVCADTAPGRTIFTAPTKMGKGILVSPTADGNIILGPTAEDIDDKDDTGTVKDSLDYVARTAKAMVPGIKISPITSFSGIRAVGSDGDFIIRESSKDFITLGGIESPGLTSAPAIGRYVREMLVGMGLTDRINPGFVKGRLPLRRCEELDDEELDALIKEDPAYGRIVCRCEGISEGEIRDAIISNPRPRTLDGIKHRVRAGMGRCQGGFCSPTVISMIARENGMELKDVTLFGKGSYIVTGRTKDGNCK